MSDSAGPDAPRATMKRAATATLTAAAILAAACTTEPTDQRAAQPLPSGPPNTVDSPAPAAVPTRSAPEDPEDSDVTVGRAAGAEVDRHERRIDFEGPVPWPEKPPPDATPVEIVTWAATVMANTSSEQTFDPSVIAPFLTPALTHDYRVNSTLPGPGSDPAVTRGDVIHTETDPDTATAYRTQVDVIVELTTSDTAGFAHLALRFTLTRQHDQRRWLIAGITLATGQ